MEDDVKRLKKELKEVKKLIKDFEKLHKRYIRELKKSPPENIDEIKKSIEKVERSLDELRKRKTELESRLNDKIKSKPSEKEFSEKDKNKKDEEESLEELQKKKIKKELEKTTLIGKFKEALMSAGVILFITNVTTIIALSVLLYFIFSSFLEILFGGMGTSLAFLISLGLVFYLLYKFATSKNTVMLVVVTIVVYLLNNMVIAPTLDYLKTSIIPKYLTNAFLDCVGANRFGILNPEVFMECSRLIGTQSKQLDKKRMETYTPLKLSVDGALFLNSNSIITLTFKNDNDNLAIEGLKVGIERFDVLLPYPNSILFSLEDRISISDCERTACIVPPKSERIVIVTIDKNEIFEQYQNNVYLIKFGYSYENEVKANIKFGVTRDEYKDAPEFRNNVRRVEVSERDLNIEVNMFPGYINVDTENYIDFNGYPTAYLTVKLTNPTGRMSTVYLNQIEIKERTNDVLQTKVCEDEMKSIGSGEIKFRNELVLSCKMPLKISKDVLSNLDSFLLTEIEINIPYRIEKSYTMKTTLQDVL